MSLDRQNLSRAVDLHGAVVRVVVAEVKGSAPREVGAAMLVWPDGQDGTIGGGALELDAVRAARALLADGGRRGFRRIPLGPSLGQCCGGAVALLSEVWDRAALADLGDVVARPVDGALDEKPLSVTRLEAAARARGALPDPKLIDGWFVEQVAPRPTPVWIWGAGHVGRAIVDTLAPLPQVAITWVDTGLERFPHTIANGVTALPAPDIVAAVPMAPRDAHHLVLTYSHALDLALCDALLRHGFASAGVIGSDTKWARFRSRLGQMGHSATTIARIDCPIGDKRLGKHPQAIALGIGHRLLIQMAQQQAAKAAPEMQRGQG